MITSDDMARAFVKALGAPLDQCMGVEISLERGDVATVTLVYSLDAETVRKAGEIAQRGRGEAEQAKGGK